MSFVTKHRDRFGVEPILRVLEIPVSTFYGWGAQQRDPSTRRRQDALWALTLFPGAALRLFPRVWPSGEFYRVTSLAVTSTRPGRLLGR
jgi:hypothetical protein